MPATIESHIVSLRNPVLNAKESTLVSCIRRTGARIQGEYLTSCSSKVLLKVVKVILSYQGKELETHAILDDGSQRTMLLSTAASDLGLNVAAESLALRTVRQGTEILEGQKVSFSISSASSPEGKFLIKVAFTSSHLGLAEQTYLQQISCRFRHLQGIPLQAFNRVQPVLLIGSDHPHLFCPIDRVCLGPGEGPAAVHTCLGWTLQGLTALPASTEDSIIADMESVHVVQTMFLESSPPSSDLRHQVEKLRKIDVLPFQRSKFITQSKKRPTVDALAQLKSKITRVMVNGISRYATPLPMASLRRIERQLANNPERAAIYNQEVDKLLQRGYVNRLTLQEETQMSESCYIPHHLVEHNSKHCLVFNCSFKYQGHSQYDQKLLHSIQFKFNSNLFL